MTTSTPGRRRHARRRWHGSGRSGPSWRRYPRSRPPDVDGGPHRRPVAVLDFQERPNRRSGPRSHPDLKTGRTAARRGPRTGRVGVRVRRYRPSRWRGRHHQDAPAAPRPSSLGLKRSDSTPWGPAPTVPPWLAMTKGSSTRNRRNCLDSLSRLGFAYLMATPTGRRGMPTSSWSRPSRSTSRILRMPCGR